jgi:murein L,D-transpeptidase YafK
MAAIAALLLAALVPAHSEEPPSKPMVPLNPAHALVPGGSLLIRIFKEESELELWLLKGERLELVASYPICAWSGTLGPKEYEGDRQAPEGFYAVDLDHIGAASRHPRAIDIGFPNSLDRYLGRTGSHILVHGGCRSIGCFAMTDPVMEQIYAVAERALFGGQAAIQVHIFPFHMTEANLKRHANNRWYGFWINLKQGYDMFEATRTAPVVLACPGTYILAPDPQAGLASGAPDQCASHPLTMAAAANIGRSTAIRFAAAVNPARVGRVRSALPQAALSLPRDNVVECARLWTRDTGVSRQNWETICKRLDFQGKGLVRAVHRSPRSAQLPRT